VLPLVAVIAPLVAEMAVIAFPFPVVVTVVTVSVNFDPLGTFIPNVKPFTLPVKSPVIPS